jgi:hypothetical protein
MTANEHYRIQSDRLQELADTAVSVKMRDHLLSLARRYKRLARRAEKKKAAALH